MWSDACISCGDFPMQILDAGQGFDGRSSPAPWRTVGPAPIWRRVCTHQARPISAGGFSAAPPGHRRRTGRFAAARVCGAALDAGRHARAPATDGRTAGCRHRRGRRQQHGFRQGFAGAHARSSDHAARRRSRARHCRCDLGPEGVAWMPQGLPAITSEQFSRRPARCLLPRRPPRPRPAAERRCCFSMAPCLRR